MSYIVLHANYTYELRIVISQGEFEILFNLQKIFGTYIYVYIYINHYHNLTTQTDIGQADDALSWSKPMIFYVVLSIEATQVIVGMFPHHNIIRYH